MPEHADSDTAGPADGFCALFPFIFSGGLGALLEKLE
jgi:hypothetical protein